MNISCTAGNKSKLTILIHVDALRHDYISKDGMPFLHSQGAEGISAWLIPPFGFEPDGAYWTGTYPEHYQGGFHFVYDDSGGGLPLSRHIPGFLDRSNLYLQYPFRKAIEGVIRITGETARIRSQPFIAQIPFKLMKYFDYCEKNFVYEPDFSKSSPSLFDYLRMEDRQFYIQGSQFSYRSSEVRSQFLNQFRGGLDFVFLMMTDLDFTGHTFGPNSDQRRIIARQIDRDIEEIYTHTLKFYDEVDLITFGDHGMVDVTDTLDMRPFIQRLPLRLGEDYIYFLDSTFARFWSFNSGVEEYLSSELDKISKGKLLSETDISTYRIRWEGRQFGDLIFWLYGGTMIFPNFWHVRRLKKGMHGYRREVRDNHGAFMFKSSSKSYGLKQVKLEMVDVFQTTYYSLFGKPLISDCVFGKPAQMLVS